MFQVKEDFLIYFQGRRLGNKSNSRRILLQSIKYRRSQEVKINQLKQVNPEETLQILQHLCIELAIIGLSVNANFLGSQAKFKNVSWKEKQGEDDQQLMYQLYYGILIESRIKIFQMLFYNFDIGFLKQYTIQGKKSNENLIILLQYPNQMFEDLQNKIYQLKTKIKTLDREESELGSKRAIGLYRNQILRNYFIEEMMMNSIILLKDHLQQRQEGILQEKITKERELQEKLQESFSTSHQHFEQRINGMESKIYNGEKALIQVAQRGDSGMNLKRVMALETNLLVLEIRIINLKIKNILIELIWLIREFRKNLRKCYDQFNKIILKYQILEQPKSLIVLLWNMEETKQACILQIVQMHKLLQFKFQFFEMQRSQNTYQTMYF